MRRLIFSIILSSLFLTGSAAPNKAKSTLPKNNVVFIEENKVVCNEYLQELLNNRSTADALDQISMGSNDNPAIQNDDRKDNMPLKSKSSQLKVIPSVGSYLGGCNDDDYYVEISGSCFGNGWDISSVTICGVEVCRIIMQSSHLVAVYPNSGTPGTGDIVITSESMGKTTIKNGFTYQVPVSKDQAKNIQYSNVSATSGDISWTRGNGESCVVFMKQANAGFSIPSNYTTYDSSIVFGDGTQIGSTGWYCVYNGNGSSVSVSGLVTGKEYIAQVFEYNGPAGFETYLISTTTDNPKIQETIATKDRINSDSYSKTNSVSLDNAKK